MPFWASVVGLHERRHKKTLQLLALIFQLAVHVKTSLEQIFAMLPREAFSPQMQPIVPSPGHGSWPSGHATEAFLAANLIESLLDAATPANSTPIHRSGTFNSLSTGSAPSAWVAHGGSSTRRWAA